MYWALDIETQDWEIFVLGSAVSESGTVIEFHTIDAMAKWYMGLDARDIVLAHNGGRFDFLCLIDALPNEEWTGTLAGSGLISCRVLGHADCMDTYRLFPMKLATWTGAKDELGLACSCGQCPCSPDGRAEKCTCGRCGYCSIKVDMPLATRARVMAYCVQDARCLLHTFIRDVERAESEGWEMRDSKGRVRRTIGGVAWHTARNRFDADDKRVLKKDKATGSWRYSLDGDSWDAWNEHDTTRAGYFGGHCEVFKVESSSGGRYDINSAYPWALTQPVPVGRPRYVSGADAARALATQQPGIYHATVVVPDAMVSPLPLRYGNRLIWPVGILTGAWSRDDLLLSLAESGGSISAVHHGVIYPTEEALFKPYMEHVFTRRAIAAQVADKAWREWTKLAGNALSGKLAQGPEAETLRLTDRPSKHWRWLGGRAHVQISRRVATSARPMQAAALTARVRHVQWRMLTGRGIPVIGPELGAWKPEGGYLDWVAHAPKVYRYTPLDWMPEFRVGPPVYGDTDSAFIEIYFARPPEHGKPIVKIKGIPDSDPSKYDAYTSGERVSSTRGVQGIRSALTREERAFARRDLLRGSNSDPRIAGTRYVLSDGTTMPLHVDADGKLSWPGSGMDPETVL